MNHNRMQKKNNFEVIFIPESYQGGETHVSALGAVCKWVANALFLLISFCVNFLMTKPTTQLL
jgi:hypothetical protein